MQHTLWEQGCSRVVREPCVALVQWQPPAEVPVAGVSLWSAWQEDAQLGAESLPAALVPDAPQRSVGVAGCPGEAPSVCRSVSWGLGGL